MVKIDEAASISKNGLYLNLEDWSCFNRSHLSCIPLLDHATSTVDPFIIPH